MWFLKKSYTFEQNVNLFNGLKLVNNNNLLIKNNKVENTTKRRILYKLSTNNNETHNYESWKRIRILHNL